MWLFIFVKNYKILPNFRHSTTFFMLHLHLIISYLPYITFLKINGNNFLFKDSFNWSYIMTNEYNKKKKAMFPLRPMIYKIMLDIFVIFTLKSGILFQVLYTDWWRQRFLFPFKTIDPVKKVPRRNIVSIDMSFNMGVQ